MLHSPLRLNLLESYMLGLEAAEVALRLMHLDARVVLVRALES